MIWFKFVYSHKYIADTINAEILRKFFLGENIFSVGTFNFYTSESTKLNTELLQITMFS
jgi:hypothetical protein